MYIVNGGVIYYNGSRLGGDVMRISKADAVLLAKAKKERAGRRITARIWQRALAQLRVNHRDEFKDLVELEKGNGSEPQS